MKRSDLDTRRSSSKQTGNCGLANTTTTDDDDHDDDDNFPLFMRPPPVSAGRVEEADGVRPLPPVVVPELNRRPSGMQRCPDTTTLCAAWHRQSEHPGLPHSPPPRPKVVPVYLLGHPYGKVIHSGWGRHWKDQIRQRLGVPVSISIGIKRGKVFCCFEIHCQHRVRPPPTPKRSQASSYSPGKR